MKVLCAKSGIEFQVQHFPGYLTEREAEHPIFNIPQKHLLLYLRKWSAHELTDIDSYLLYLALLDSTDLIQWRVPAKRTNNTRAIVAANMEPLARIINYTCAISHPSFVMHKIAISPDTADLSTSHFWIDNWYQSYVSFCEGYKDEVKHDKIVRRERSMDRLLADISNMPIEKFARILSEWACDVADFPTHYITINNKPITLADYWKSIIIRCVKSDAVFTIPEYHLLKLHDYCEEVIDLHGTSYGKALMDILRSGIKKLNDPFGLEEIDFDVKHPGFIILTKQQENSVEAANIAAMIAAAPKTKPLESEIGSVYPSKIAYLRASARWEAAEKDRLAKAAIVDKLESAEVDNVIEPIEPNPIDDAMDIEELVEPEIEIEDEENLA